MTTLWTRLGTLLRLTPAPAHEGPDYQASWDRLAKNDALNAICDGADQEAFERWGREHGDKLRQFLQPDWRVLDFGCGIGRLETYLAPHCREMHGVDISSEMLAGARARLAGTDGVHFHQLSGPALPMFADGYFDFAFAMLVFHHIAKQDAYLVLRELRRVLRPGGRLFINFPNLLSEQYTKIFHDYAMRRERAAHRVRPYTPEEVRWLLERVNITVEQFSSEEEIEVLGSVESA
jgi:ubiquinone/menaquinone biosynthesis C-methylase UbiE